MAKQPAKRGMDLRTVVLVSLVTLMVWLLAESRTVGVQAAEISVRMETGPDSELVVRSAPGFGWPGAVKVNLAGSTAGLGQVLRSLQGVLNLRVGIEIPASAGVHEIDLREVMRTSEVFIEAGVTVSEVTPDRVRVQVDELTVASLPVRAIVPDGVAFESTGAPRPRPSSLRVIGPAGVLARLEGQEALVRLEPAVIDALRPGQSETVTRVRVELPEDPDRWRTEFDPEFVDVTMTLRSRTQSYTLAPMPIQVLLAPGEVGRWSVSLQPGQQDLVGVEVTGPSDQIDRLRSGEVVPTALISLTFDELERGVESKQAQVQGLPPGVQVSAGANLGVRLSVRRTDPAAAAAD